MEIKPLERMRIGRAARDVQEVTMLLRPNRTDKLDSLRPPRPKILSGGNGRFESGDKLAELAAENKRLRAGVDRAVKINERMWNGIVDLQLSRPGSNGHVEINGDVLS